MRKHEVIISFDDEQHAKAMVDSFNLHAHSGVKYYLRRVTDEVRGTAICWQVVKRHL